MPLSAFVAYQPSSHPKSGAGQSKPGWTQPLSPDQKTLQLLNRITFGPRPSDVDRVRQIGFRAFLDQQLHPERISDLAVKARLMKLPTLTMTSQELVENYPAPKQVLRQGQKPEAPAPGAEPRRPGRRSDIPSATKGSDTALTGTMGAPTIGTARSPEREMDPGRNQMTVKPAAGWGVPMDGPQRVIMELAQGELIRAIYSERQLQEVMIQFWMNHFNIFAPKGADKWLITSFERDTIRPRALGKFENLLLATAKSPAMLFYLDNWQSCARNPNGGGESSPFKKPPASPQSLQKLRPQQQSSSPGNVDAAQRKPGLNENYSRELMELHTLGVSGGYTQRDVIEVARCLTGWSIDKPQQGGGFIFRPRMHDYGEKLVLGHAIPAGRSIEDGFEVVNILAHQPATAHYISLKLCRHFVADDPPASVVDRAAKTFMKSNGDIRAVLKSILTSREFFSQAAYRVKVKSPLELVASSLRALGAQTEAGPQVLRFIARMGEPMFQYQAPTGFPDRGSTWISSSTLLERMKYAVALAANRLPGTEVNWDALAGDDSLDSYEGYLKKLNDTLLEGSLSAQSREAIIKWGPTGRAPSGEASAARSGLGQRDRAIIAATVLAAPEFQRR